MSKNRSQNALLVEIMIAVLFFALCSTVILETFVAAREYSRRAGVQNEALVELQDLAERLYVEKEADQLMKARGFTPSDEGWELDAGDYTVEVKFAQEEAPAGTLNTALLRALYGDKLLAELPWARYVPGEADA